MKKYILIIILFIIIEFLPFTNINPYNLFYLSPPAINIFNLTNEMNENYVERPFEIDFEIHMLDIGVLCSLATSILDDIKIDIFKGNDSATASSTLDMNRLKLKIGDKLKIGVSGRYNLEVLNNIINLYLELLHDRNTLQSGLSGNYPDKAKLILISS